MLSVVQVVTHANVKVDGDIIGSIQKGILALVGLEKTDSEEEVHKLCHKIMNYRIFHDDNGKTNLSLLDIQGGLLLVPQFTLVADTAKGMRPGYSTGMPPQEGKKLFEYLVDYAKTNYSSVACGMFGADMKVTLCNDGPRTFILRV